MRRCDLCPNVNRLVGPDGPRGDLLFIGEAPGKDENREGRPFCGKTGREVNEHYLPLIGRSREQCRFINTICCLPNTPQGKLYPDRPAHQALARSCADAHLYQEMLAHEPKLLIPMGSFACTAVDPAISLELHHGRPFLTHWGVWAFPMYHPALGIHSPKKMLEIRTDWIRLKKYLRGDLSLPEDLFPEPDYAEITDVDTLYALDCTKPLGCDTETSPSVGPYCLTLSDRPGWGRLIRAERRDLLDAFQEVLDCWEGPILWHNWLYDRQIVRRMRLRFRDRLIVDTMVKLFHLGNLPQGLKPFAYRELGMTMQDFPDVVKPHSTPLALDYFRRAQAHTWPKPEPRMEQDSKSGELKLKKPQGMNTKLKRFFTDLSKNPAKDPFDMWEKNWKDEQGMIEAVMGPFPEMDIAHVPFEQALYYACRDADALVRAYPVIRGMQARVRKYSQEEWRAV